MRTLFLNPPSYAGFDGGAGARYQAKREIRSFWYPTWLAQPAALVPDSLLVDAPPAGKSLADIVPLAAGRDLAVLYTSSPTFAGDVKVAEALKERNPRLARRPRRPACRRPSPGVPRGLDRRSTSWPARSSTSRSRRSPRARPLRRHRRPELPGRRGEPVHNADRAILEDMDQLPSVLPVYKRDLRIEDYFIGYLSHPYVSLYTGRGCRSRCTFCLWPQTVGGHRYRTKSVGARARRGRHGQGTVPADEGAVLRRRHVHRRPAPGGGDRARPRQARPHLVVQRQGERAERDPEDHARQRAAAAARRLRVGRPADPHQHQEGPARRAGASSSPGTAATSASPIHGTFILGLPGETKETIQETIKFAREVNPHTIQVSVAAPYPGTELYRQAQENGWLPADDEGATLVSASRHAARGAVLPAPRPDRDLRLGETTSTSGSTSGPARSPRCPPRCSATRPWPRGGCARAPSSSSSSAAATVRPSRRPLQAGKQPGVNLADARLGQRQVPVVVEQPGLDTRDPRGEPLPVPERHELVIPARA